MQLKGIDVSKYQGNIDWKKVKAAGISFAFIRVGYAGYEGNIVVDSKYHYNIKNATANGIDVGVYVYSYCKTVAAAKRAAKETLELVKPYFLSYPIAFDIEDNIYIKNTKAFNSQIASSFLNEIIFAKYYAMLYTYTYFANSFLDMNALSKFDLWIADYRTKLGYNGKYSIWQYTDKGKVDGIKTQVDLNYGYKDHKSLIQTGKLNNYKEQKPKKYSVNVFSFLKKEIADNLYYALKFLDINSEVKLLDNNQYSVVISNFSKYEHAKEISQSLKLLKNYYSEIREVIE